MKIRRIKTNRKNLVGTCRIMGGGFEIENGVARSFEEWEIRVVGVFMWQG